ncbi:DUF6797 domain-containing protein [uncultured Arcticibacterium sp.]|uniref:DUF6797 domain-containing protein n=1 Tax=uncultured Arcticibacterium sp. TaxID=2173042 RepID=UPI0030F818EB
MVILITLLFASLLSCSFEKTRVTENPFDPLSFKEFVEPDFPFFSTYIDARKIGVGFPENNVVSRGLVILLDDSSYVCFDRDLLRWSVAWTGEGLTKSMLPEVSYRDFFNKKNSVPLVAGKPDLANGIYPGWSRGKRIFNEVRPKGQYSEGFTWGALQKSYGHWNGVYVYGSKVVLSYDISGTEIFEMPGSVRHGDETIYTRALEVGASEDTLFLNATELIGGIDEKSDGENSYIYYGEKRDSVVAVSVVSEGSLSKPLVAVTEGRHLSVSFPPSNLNRKATVFLWKGAVKDLEKFHFVRDTTRVGMPMFNEGGSMRWNDEVLTKGKLGVDTASFVTDLLTLPIPNPWKRNIRVMDIAFMDNNKAAVTTFEGDVWILSGIDDKLESLTWRRFASGLYEPMSIEVYKEDIYVYGKEGIIRLHDLNGDGEADYYENFSDVMQQSAESYEWASDMVISEKHSIIISKGGGLTARPGITKTMTEGFRAGSNHAGVVMRISLDGKQSEVLASGFRAPYLGFDPISGALTATDQQGNYVPSTPIYVIDSGDYFGVPATKHREDSPDPKRPLSWIPHRVDRSPGSQVWVTSDKMGPLNQSLLHFSFGRPGLFKVLIDSTSKGLQGGVVSINSYYSTPVIKGEIGPLDGQLYMAGFNLFGSSSKGISAIQRLRYTGKNSYIPNGIKTGKQGIMLSFDSQLDAIEAFNLFNYRVKRWNYKRTKHYGSGHFTMDGEAGEEVLPVVGSYLSADKKSVLLLILDIKEVDQMEVLYTLKASDGTLLNDGVWLSVNYVESLDLELFGFEGVDLSKLDLNGVEMSSLMKYDPPITRDRGKELFEKMGCLGCHSPGTETAGMYGPPFKGLYGSERKMTDGSTIQADDSYLRESILEPEKKIVEGYEAEMPSFQGILSEPDIDALLLYIMYLKY